MLGRAFPLLLSAACVSLSAALTLTGDEVWVVSSTEPRAVALAIADVLRDAYLVLGRRPLVLSKPPAPGAAPANTTLVLVGTLDAAPWLGSLFPSVAADCASGWEAHCVQVMPSTGGVPGYPRAIVATGAGARGSMYGAYALSELVLGVNPWYHYTDDVPVYAAPLEVADGFTALFAPPRFRYRGIFINDEDLLANQFPDPLGRAAIDARAYNVLLETLLRLKGNVIIPATNPFPDQEVNALVGRRGLVLAFHHYDLVGGNVFSWPLPSSDWSWTQDPGSMAAMWRASIAAQADIPDVLWSIGLRGLNDYSYPCTGHAECGKLISEALGNQTSWIRAVQPNATLVLYLWQELLDILASGDLIIPEGVKIVFTDAGSGYIRVDSNWSTYCSGVYYHTAMLDGTANQLTEMIPVDRIITQFAPVVNKSKATDIMIDNVSDLRPVPMTTDMLLKFVWDPAPYLAVSDPVAAALAHYAAWGAQQHHIPGGATAPAAVAYARLWADLFDVPYIQGALSDNFLAGAIQGAASSGARGVHGDGTVPAAALDDARRAVARLSNGSDASGASVVTALAALLSRAEDLSTQLPPARVGYFTSHTLLQVRLHAGSTAALVGVLDTLTAASARNWPAAALAAGNALAAAERVLEALRDGEAASYPGTWRGLYAGDYLSNMQRARDWVLALTAAVAAPGPGAPPLPLVDGANLWYAWDFAWQGAPEVRAAYPLSQRVDPNVAFAVMPRINCEFADSAAGTCTPNADGGLWVRGRGGAVTIQVMTSQTVTATPASAPVLRYTLDGAAPTPSSPAYEPGHPLVLDALVAAGADTVTITAAVFAAASDGGAQLGGARTTLWRAVP